MKKFALYSDLIFSFFVTAILGLCFFRYLKIVFVLSLLLSVLCGGLVTLALAAYLFSKRKHLFLKGSDEAQKEKLLFHLALSSDEAKTAYFLDFFKKEYAAETPRRFSKLRLQTDTRFFFLRFSFSPVSADEVAAIARLKTSKQKQLLCDTIEEAALALCRRLGIEVKTGNDVYVALKEAEFLPERYLGEDCKAAKKKRFTLWFSKRNAKRFLVGATMLFLLSQLTPFPFYYLLWGGILALAAVFTRIFGYA